MPIDNNLAMWQVSGMTLEKYLRDKGIRASAFAEQVGASASTITRIMRGERGIGLELAVRIERATEGQVPIRAWLDELTATEPGE